VHANKAVKNTVEQNKVGGDFLMGETISRRRGRLYYDRGETLLRLRGDFRMGETISCDTGVLTFRPPSLDRSCGSHPYRALTDSITQIVSISADSALQCAFIYIVD